jgi:ribosomal protein S4
MFSVFVKKYKFRVRSLRFFLRRYRKVFDYSTAMRRYKRRRNYRKEYIKNLRDLMHFRIYYGISSIKKLRKYLTRVNKRRFDFESRLLFLLESRLDILLVRLNLFSNLKEARIFVQNGNVLVRNKINSNLYYHLYIHEMVSIKKKYRSFFYKKILKKLKRREILFNFPKYIEISYKLFK